MNDIPLNEYGDKLGVGVLEEAQALERIALELQQAQERLCRRAIEGVYLRAADKLLKAAAELRDKAKLMPTPYVGETSNHMQRIRKEAGL